MAINLDCYEYTMCASCDHFIEPNEMNGKFITYSHLDSGEKDHDHDASVRSHGTLLLAQWKAVRPDLFIKHEDDEFGPNSTFHIPLKKPEEDTHVPE